MTWNRQLCLDLTKLVGAPMPRTLSAAADKGIGIEIDLTAVDSLSCAVRELRLNVPALSGAGFDVLKTWAARLCQRVTYLLENIGPLELEPDSGRLLIRSTTPERQDGTRKYYEILLQSHAGGQFTLRRYRYEAGGAGRAQVEMPLTHEVLGKLLGDLVETAPTA